MNRRSGHDAILADIRSAVAVGHFDERDAEGPSELERTSVEELLLRTAMMSSDRRHEELARRGHLRADDTLSTPITHVRLRRLGPDEAGSLWPKQAGA